MNFPSDTDPLSKKGIAAGFLMLLGECVLAYAAVDFVFSALLDHRLVWWDWPVAAFGALLTWCCFTFICTPAAYAQPVQKMENS